MHKKEGNMPWVSRSDLEVRQKLNDLAQGQAEMRQEQKEHHRDLHDMRSAFQSQLTQMMQNQQNHQDAMSSAQQKDSKNLLFGLVFGFIGVIIALLLGFFATPDSLAAGAICIAIPSSLNCGTSGQK